MKGCTNLMFLYENSKFNEAYLDNMYRKSLSTGKYIAEVRLNNYQEALINHNSTTDEIRAAKIYNFLADRFEDINSIKQYGECDRSKKNVLQSQELIQDIFLNNSSKTFTKKQYVLKDSTLKFLIAIIVSIVVFTICYGVKSRAISTIVTGINAIVILFVIESIYEYFKERDSLLRNINKSKNLMNRKIYLQYSKM
ncbi:hypothetical protein U732_1917 [Clostridium argentinense CDC 2741]|uniref:Uncharacterized protein n=1 Tax=Clostridium argentinense CDC 2741 TaxID=1418104 RepID=A0A0C1R7C1_9CLOT|nr:hypothetical protein [Clostridium argentinense]ARC85876.1 hypothetical protein RSJ17_15940 [Clostridium argentinense]KIE46406.1 hypothetical protein U732_1917 [Clostridium argentinense CDC 2741]NFF41640.1 hypothetical protein [Clostridium argentinense]NFP48596.1 hypothetical protein [Clostridium argentinense]NFP71136.1 hypothetical protein [Clostridium argentinense]